MTSKEALERVVVVSAELLTQILQNLERLEELEKENQTNKDFINVQNEVLKIKEDEITELKKVIEILKDKIEFEDLGEMQSGNMYRGYFNDCLDEEEVKSVKEVFGNENYNNK